MNLLTPEQFEARYGELYSSRFSRVEPWIEGFPQEGWGQIWLPEPHPMEVGDYFPALVRSANHCGDYQIVLVDEKGPRGGAFEGAIEVPLDDDAVASARAGYLPMGMDGLSPSGRWGLLVTEWRATCVGGDPEFRSRFLQELGGPARVSETFDRWTRSIAKEFSPGDIVPLLRRAAGLPALEQPVEFRSDLGCLLVGDSGSLGGNLWLRRGVQAFPEPGAPALLGEILVVWCQELQRLLTGPGRETYVQSLDGPYLVRLLREEDDHLTLVGLEQGAETIRWENVDLVSLSYRIHDLAWRVVRRCREGGLEFTELEQLERTLGELSKALRGRQ